MADQPPSLPPIQPPSRPPKELNQQKASEKFAEFWKDPVVCPACKTNEWYFGPNLEHLFHLSELGTPNISIVTTVPVFCKKCGYIMLFSAEHLGLNNG